MSTTNTCSLKKTRKWILHLQNKYKLGTITTHGLRHTQCSLLFEAGASYKEVQDCLEHADVQTTIHLRTSYEDGERRNNTEVCQLY